MKIKGGLSVVIIDTEELDEKGVVGMFGTTVDDAWNDNVSTLVRFAGYRDGHDGMTGEGGTDCLYVMNESIKVIEEMEEKGMERKEEVASKMAKAKEQEMVTSKVEVVIDPITEEYAHKTIMEILSMSDSNVFSVGIGMNGVVIHLDPVFEEVGNILMPLEIEVLSKMATRLVGEHKRLIDEREGK